MTVDEFFEIMYGVLMLSFAVSLFHQGHKRKDWVIFFQGFTPLINGLIVALQGVDLISSRNVFLLWLSRGSIFVLCFLSVIHAVNGQLNDILDSIYLRLTWTSKNS